MSEVLVWRLCAKHRAPYAFTGEGAARRGGRWNQLGTRVAYCAESRSLAALEVLVNADHHAWLTTIQWVCIPAVIPAGLIERPARFPKSWRTYPYTDETRDFGTLWAKESRSVALRIPSAVVAGEFNYLVNPLHPKFSEVKFGRSEVFSFDPRLGRAGH